MRDILTITLTIVMLSIILFMAIFLIHEDYAHFKKTFSYRKYAKSYDKKIIKKIENVNVKRVEIHQIFDWNGYREIVVDPNKNPIYKGLTKYELKKNKGKAKKVFRIFFDLLFILLFVGVIAFSIYSSITKTVLTINNKTYVTIASGSMSLKHEENSYLEENNLNNQIPTYSLIGLEKIDQNEEIKQYGVYAYKNKEGDLIVHRVVKIEIKDNGEKYYTFKGDANPVSDYYLVKEEQILYEYKGDYNMPLGYIFSFIKDEIGFITTIYVLIALIVLDAYDAKKDKIDKVGLNEYLKVLNQAAQDEFNKGDCL